MNEWKSASGRISLFPSNPGVLNQTSAFDLYKRIWSGEPETYQKAATPLMPSAAQGRHDSVNRGCLVQPNRIDFSIAPVQSNPVEGPESLPLMENARELRRQLTEIIEAVGSGLTPDNIARVAIVAQFLSPQEGHIQANRVLLETQPEQYRVSITNEEDFVLQVNQPYENTAAGLVRVNAVTKWSVERLQVLTLNIMPGSTYVAPTVSPASTSIELITANILIEHNNIIQKGPLSLEQQSKILSEGLSRIGRAQQEFGLRVEGF
jgi:hypothetical protein